MQSISPGFVDTEIFDAAKIQNSKLNPSVTLSAEEMADMIAFVMSTKPNILVIITYILMIILLVSVVVTMVWQVLVYFKPWAKYLNNKTKMSDVNTFHLCLILRQASLFYSPRVQVLPAPPRYLYNNYISFAITIIILPSDH